MSQEMSERADVPLLSNLRPEAWEAEEVVELAVGRHRMAEGRVSVKAIQRRLAEERGEVASDILDDVASGLDQSAENVYAAWPRWPIRRKQSQPRHLVRRTPREWTADTWRAVSDPVRKYFNDSEVGRRRKIAVGAFLGASVLATSLSLGLMLLGNQKPADSNAGPATSTSASEQAPSTSETPSPSPTPGVSSTPAPSPGTSVPTEATRGTLPTGPGLPVSPTPSVSEARPSAAPPSSSMPAPTTTPSPSHSQPVAPWEGPTETQEETHEQKPTTPAPPVILDGSSIDYLEPWGYAGQRFEWGVAADQVGPERATTFLLETIDDARSNGLQVVIWGDPDCGRWGITNVTVELPDGGHKTYFDTVHKLALIQHFGQSK